jgi:hypothetical protein
MRIDWLRRGVVPRAQWQKRIELGLRRVTKNTPGVLHLCQGIVDE